MLNRNSFLAAFGSGVHLLDGATGTALMSAGFARDCCQEKWIIEHPHTITDLQLRYSEAGSEIIYAPTFQANPIALARYGLEDETESINIRLVRLSRSTVPNRIIAGNLTTIRTCIDTSDARNYQQMISAYRRQIRALIDGGADILAFETLLYFSEAKAALEAASAEGSAAVIISFALKNDGTLRSGEDAVLCFAKLEQYGAAALGINCMAADASLPPIIQRLKDSVSVPIICKPNIGRAAGGVYPIDLAMFNNIMQRCIENGASLVGGCCGTTPEYIAALKKRIT